MVCFFEQVGVIFHAFQVLNFLDVLTANSNTSSIVWEFQGIWYKVENHLLKPLLICSNQIIFFCLWNDLVIRIMALLDGKIFHFDNHINSILFSFVLLNQHNFFNWCFYIKVLTIFSEFSRSKLGKIKNIIDQKIKNFSTRYLYLTTIRKLLLYILQLLLNLLTNFLFITWH